MIRTATAKEDRLSQWVMRFAMACQSQPCRIARNLGGFATLTGMAMAAGCQLHSTKK
jgi:hypothetical protein